MNKTTITVTMTVNAECISDAKIDNFTETLQSELSDLQANLKHFDLEIVQVDY